MTIKLLHGVAGYWCGDSYQFSCGSIQVVPDALGRDLVRNNNAIETTIEKEKRAKAEPPQNFAEVPMIKKREVVKAVIKRGKKRV